MYKEVESRPDFPQIEEEILRFWDGHRIFERSIEQNADGEPFTFYDGPPFATGLPHYGHIMVGVLKDAVQRYNTMLGKYVPRRFGWDCHGLPVEYETEKLLGISGKSAIEAYGIDRFNEKCRSIVQKFTSEWRSTVRRSGRWVDFEHEYRTMDVDYMESIWWVVGQLWEKGLLYKDHYILPYCPRCSTVLSNHDVALGGYREIHDPALTVRFTLTDEALLPESFQKVIANSQSSTVSLLAWTTTPWTLPANLGLALNADLDYALLQDNENGYIILLQSQVGRFVSKEAKILALAKGEQLAGLEYKPLFGYFADLKNEGGFRTHCAEFVSGEEGSGIVHCAPGFGEDDFKMLKKAGVPPVTPIDEECRYTSEIADFAGQFVRDANKNVIQHLKKQGSVFLLQQILHPYPHCWRCESPLIYRSISSWFVKVASLREKLLASNAQIYWVPDHLQEGRFGNWLRGARDWSISRNRYWGNPIPIWECEAGHQRCLSSRAELEQLTGQKIADLHKHFIDHLQFDCEECAAQGQERPMQRASEVLDCWFESGAMPYAQNHYPFENKERFEQNFPAHFINESLDQTRGWFYTLTVLSTALFERPAFRSCVTSGMILAEDGKKMSKSLRNYTPPEEVMDSFGADAMRLYLLSSSVVRGEPLRFSDNGVKNILKSIILPLWNAYSFYATYANADKIFPCAAPQNPQNSLDQWILSELETLIERFRTAMEQLLLPQAVTPLLEFIDLLNNWYIRRSRRRFWKSNHDTDKSEAYATLWHVLNQLAKICAPLIPFLSERIYLGLQTDAQQSTDSVHLCRFPQARHERRKDELEAQMGLARRCVSLGRSLRAQQQIRNRLPLSEVRIVTRDERERTLLQKVIPLIKDELNVQRVCIDESEEELVSYTAKANFRLLGKLLGKDIKSLAAKIQTLDSAAISEIMAGKSHILAFTGQQHNEFVLKAEHLDIRREEKQGFCILNDGSLTVALQTALTPQLQKEGLIRDLVRLVQSQRKDADLKISQRIEIHINGSNRVKEALEAFGPHLLKETQGKNWQWCEEGLETHHIGGEKDSELVKVGIQLCN